MYVCVCHAITEADVENCIAEGAKTLADLRGCLGIAGTCGHCATLAEQMLEQVTAAEISKPELKVA
jgi:bacterioferritin-associated ferredoxin